MSDKNIKPEDKKPEDKKPEDNTKKWIVLTDRRFAWTDGTRKEQGEEFFCPKNELTAMLVERNWIKEI